MHFVSDPCFIYVVLKAQIKLISMTLTTFYHAAYSDPSAGLELNITPVISPVKTDFFQMGYPSGTTSILQLLLSAKLVSVS